MLGLMGQMGAAIFHLVNAYIRIVRMGPVLIRSFLGPLSVQACQVFSGWRCDPGSLRQPHQKYLVTLTPCRAARCCAAPHSLQAWSRPLPPSRSEEHTSELQSRGLISYAVFCLKKK